MKATFPTSTPICSIESDSLSRMKCEIADELRDEYAAAMTELVAAQRNMDSKHTAFKDRLAIRGLADRRLGEANWSIVSHKLECETCRSPG